MYEVSSEKHNSGYCLRIGNKKSSWLGKGTSFEPVNWNDGIAKLDPMTAALLDELDQQGKLSIVESDSAIISFATVAELQNTDAFTLKLPPAFPFQLDIQSVGSLGSPEFRIAYSATQSGIRKNGSFSEGLFTTGGKDYRLAGVMYSIIEQINRVNSETLVDRKIAQVASLRLILPDRSAKSSILAEDYLLRMRISHVTALSLSPSTVDGNVNFDPVPMKRKDAHDHEAGAELSLSPDKSETFAGEFRIQANVNSTYALGPGEYLYIDPSIRTALQVVKRKQSASLEEKMAFLISPSKYITEAYKNADGEENETSVGDTIFFETTEYSQRVRGIGEWIPPNLPYLERDKNNWLPERFSVVLGGKLVTGEPNDIPQWIENVKSAIDRHETEVVIGGVSVPTDSPGLLTSLKKLLPPETPGGKGTSDKSEKDTQTRRRQVLITARNFDAHEFKKRLEPRSLEDKSFPLINSQMKQHQIDGVSWLVSAYSAGWPGVLLADDMGLGKTLQSLAFLMLLRRENVIRSGRPALVVAPTSLLRNWQDEHKKHLASEGLGKPLIAFGSKLKELKLGDTANDGLSLLDSAKIADSTWVLTTYETVRDYHLSFAQVEFSVAVLDEIQKAKNPTTRINATLLALNIDFVLSMTGTPVENSISDLWAITDITAPGYLPPLRDFMKLYGKGQDVEIRQAQLKKLSNELLNVATTDAGDIPPFAFRRLKEDVAKDLPPKHQSPMLRETMPPIQAQRYADVSSATQAGSINILRALHDFRSISLHPSDPETAISGLVKADEYIALSARLSKAFEILDQINAKGEKVIIFVNSRRIQNVLARLIESRFGCSKPEHIRGDTIANQRQEVVNRFSKLNGFAALILSPRAAGVGLNIVAANHVIHLDRWWNPAVEDQCTDRAYRIGATKPVYVYAVGAVHPVLKENSYDVILDKLLTSRRETSKRIFTSTEIMPEDFADALRNGSRPQRSDADILREIDNSGYLALEELIQDQLISEGFNANVTRRTGDGGADLVVRDELGEIIFLVQCKHTNNWKNAIDAGLAEDARRVRDNWRAPNAKVIGVSNAEKFSPSVIAEFAKIDGRLIARNELTRLKFS